MFKRRTQLSRWQRIKGFLWPSMGVRRLSIYFAKRILRIPGTPHSIAAGFASGIAASFTPFVGFHMPIAFYLAHRTRSSMIAALFGTFGGNLATIPFMWYASFQCGVLILSVFFDYSTKDANLAIHTLMDFSFSDIGGYLDRILQAKFLKDLFLPMAIGCFPAAFIAWFATFFPLRALIASFRRRQAVARAQRYAAIRAALEARQRAAASESPGHDVTGQP